MHKPGSILDFEREDLIAFANIECTINGKTRTLKSWAFHHNLYGDLIRSRLKRGWSPEDAFTLPIGGGIQRHYRQMGV